MPEVRTRKKLIEVLFSSASAAASVFLGSQANGCTSWKDAEGRTLAQIQNEALAAGGTS